MPRYDYTCEENGRTVEVMHPMDTLVSTWGELCELAAVEPGETPGVTPVKKEMSTGTIIESAAKSSGVSLPQSCGCGKRHGCGGH